MEWDGDIPAWCERRMRNMQDFEDREIVLWHIPTRNAIAHWVIRCLANPECEGSADVLAAIHNQREQVLNDNQA